MRRSENMTIFIVGMSRSGTTLLSRILNSCDEVYILEETHFVREYVNKFPEVINDNEMERIVNKFITIQKKGIYGAEKPEQCVSVIDDIREKLFENRYVLIDLIKCLFSYEARKRNKKIVGDQTPNHVFYIDYIVNNFENVRIINMVRDPRAVIASQKYKHLMAKSHNQPKYEVIRTRINYHPITQSILWKRSVKSALRGLKRYKNIINVKYEDLVSDPEKEIKRITQFIGIEYQDKMLNVDVGGTSNIERKKKNGFDKYLMRAWTKKLNPTEIFITEKICKNEALQLGYDLSGERPEILSLIYYLTIFPIHVMLAFFYNYKRLSKTVTKK